MDEKRFSRITDDAKYRRIPKKNKKVTIDNRFQSMFTDKHFKERYTVDKHGKPLNQSTTQDLKEYYNLSSSEDSSEEENETCESQEVDLEQPNTLDKVVSLDVKKKLKNLRVDYARGEQNLFSESSSDDELSEDSSEEEIIEHNWGEQDKEIEETKEISNRLAVCNMDWDRIRALDIMVILNSFLPPGGIIKSVKIYISEFGKKRLAEEDIYGPSELREIVKDENEEEDEEGSKYHMEKLRQYQLNRLKYYYAVVEFNDANAANQVYTDCDGMEYESSSTKIDLRFIPEDMQFDEEPKEICDKIPEMNKYQPRFFITTALQQAKVNLTWDETNLDRIELTEKINSGDLDNIQQDELNNFFASSDDSDCEEKTENLEDTEENNSVDKYKLLLLDLEEKEKEKKNNDIQMEVSWNVSQEKKTEELVKQRLTQKEEKTPFQQYLDKRKEKRKERKKLKNHSKDDDSDSDIPSDIDMNDPYFKEEFENSEFSKNKSKKKLKEKTNDPENNEEQDKLQLLLMNDTVDTKKHFSLKNMQEHNNSKLKRKKKKNDNVNDQNDDFELDVEDARFSAIYSSHQYNIDPSDSNYKSTKGMEKLIEEKFKRRTQQDVKRIKIDNNKKKDIELNLLVKSVKNKTQGINKNKR